MKQETWTAKEYQTFLKTKQKPANKGNKFGAVRAEFDGRSFDSTGEMDYAVQLDLMKKAGEVKQVEYQHKIALESNGKLVCTYKIDFRLTMPDNSIVFAEFKGKETPDWKIKWQLLKNQLQSVEKNSVLWLIKKIKGKFKTVEIFRPEK